MKTRKINIIRAGAVILGFASIFFAAPLSFAATIISVPFTSQAPSGNWVEPWQNFCEEASVVMTAHFLWGLPLTLKFAEIEMQIIKQYEEIVFKKYDDTSVDETASILKNLYGFNHIQTRGIASISDIKEELSAGNIVLLPAAGRLLRNPYFVPPGPFYHMIIVRGFDDKNHTFITNDPGTRHGNGFAYDQDILMNAVHDWNDGDVIRGQKMMIVVGR